ncbi:hypothetical protein [Streptomyces dysideae]|uniref:Integral membrane protein n=1 Tax=Streptomyces dysideae TaxID=909626 RepID=A0A117RZX4_9ACTN|nr:hypothetical protein [Streptomyces dysideae]KUO18952.1 hypothetical protein AQJ91_22355 [Streptomyces dysideae]
MHGHGYTQPVKQPPPTGWLVFLRVLFVVISIFSIGLLAWTMLLRLAIVTRKGLDWGLFVAAIAADALALVLVGTEPGDEVHTVPGWTGIGLLFGTLVASIAYYLAADVRHFHQLRYGGYAPQPQPAPAYGYPNAAMPSPYATTVPQPPLAPLTPHTPPPASPTPVPQPPPPTTPPPQRPAPARIDQVRAELDELSDYLRSHDGRQDGDHEGGR